MGADLDKVKIEGIVFKKGKDDDAIHVSGSPTIPRKQKGKTISGSAKMKAAYKVRKKARKK